MIRRIPGSDFMDCGKAKRICRLRGYRETKLSESIKTFFLASPDGKRMWPERIWEKYGG